MAVHRIKLDHYTHATFLNEGRKDPVTKESICAGMEIVICAGDKIAFVAENWTGTCPLCHGTETLAQLPLNTVPSRIGRSRIASNPSPVLPRPSNLIQRRVATAIIGLVIIVFCYILLSKGVSVTYQGATASQEPTQINNTVPDHLNTVPNHLDIGGFGCITNNVIEVNLRYTPGYLNKPGNDVITRISSGSVIEITGGPEQFDGLIWWYVLWDGHEGWVAEYSASNLLLIAPVIP